MHRLPSAVPQSQWLPQPGFHVFHHFADPLRPDALVRTCTIGTFLTFAPARTAALMALEKTLKGYERAGFRGKAFKDIDLRLRGLITRMGEDGREMPLSEFEIREVKVFGEPVLLQMGGEEERAIFEEASAKLVIKLPPKSAVLRRSTSTLPAGERPSRGQYLRHETQPEWAQSRIPYFRRRDEGPFRRAGDPPYRATMDFQPRTMRAQGLCIPQIIIMQTDELEPLAEKTSSNPNIVEPRMSKAEVKSAATRGRNLWSTNRRGRYQVNDMTRKMWQRNTGMYNEGIRS